MSSLVRYNPRAVSPNPPSSPPGMPVEEAGYYYAEQAEETHLRDYWTILRKRLRIMIPIFLAVVVLGIAINFLLPTLYTGSSILKIEPLNPTVTGVGGVGEALPGQFDTGPYDYYQTQFALLHSAPLAARVIKELHLESNPAFNDNGGALAVAWKQTMRSVEHGTKWFMNLFAGNEQRPRGKPASYELGVPPYLISRYLKYLEVEPVRNTRLVSVIFNTPDPQLSQDLANAHATSFIQMILENRFTLTQEARDFLQKKLAELRERVTKAEKKLNEYRQEHGVVSLEKGENIVVDRLVDLNRELTKARAQRIESESLYRMTRDKDTNYLTQVLNNPLIQQLKATLANLETEKGRLSSIYTPDHPRMKELGQQIGEARRALQGEIRNVVRGVESSYSAARARENALEAEAQRQQQAALDLKKVGVDYAVLNEAVTVSRGLYDAVLKRLNETNVGNDLAASNIQIVQRSELPLVPSSPATARNLTVAVLLGLLLALGYAFLAEYMDASVSTPQEVWSAVALTTLGVVPHLKSLGGRYRPTPSLNGNGEVKGLEGPRKSRAPLSKELVAVRDQLSLVAESYRTIRTALLLSQAERPPQVILLTSPRPEEGKTVTTVNLGITLAQSGHSVLLIDADLRKGRCHKLLNVENHGGLAEVLTGHLGLEEGIRPTPVANFYFLPRGALPPNPSDLLMSQRTQELFQRLRNSFDFIVIDSPPIIAVSDAAVLSAVCDGVIPVFNGKKTSKASARRAIERLESVGATILGVVLNGIDIRDPEYVDYRSYYPSYYASVGEELAQQADGSDAGYASVGEESARPADGSDAGGREDIKIENIEDVDSVMKQAGFHRETQVPTEPKENGKKQSPAGETRGIMPRHFIDRMVLKLSEILGPSASPIVRKQAGALQESLESFPASRAWELAQLVSQEILDNRAKVRFLRDMSAEIRELKSNNQAF